MDLAAWLEDLRLQGLQIKAYGDRLDCRGSAAVLTPRIKAQLATHKWPLIAWLKKENQRSGNNKTSGPKRIDQLRMDIRTARDWTDLATYLEYTERAFQCHELTQSQAEDLTRLAAKTSRTKPIRQEKPYRE